MRDARMENQLRSLTRPASSSPSASLPRAPGLFDLGGVDQSFRQSIHDMLSVSPSLSLCCFPPSLCNLATFGCASGRPSATGPAVEGLLCLLGSRNFLRDPFDKMFTQQERATHLLSSGASQNFYPLPLSPLRLGSAEKVLFPPLAPSIRSTKTLTAKGTFLLPLSLRRQMKHLKVEREGNDGGF